MKSCIAVLTLGAVSLAFSSVSFAAEKKGGGKKAPTKSFTGVVEACDAKSIKLRSQTENKTFVVNDNTMVVTADKKEATIGDIKPGNNMTVFFVERWDRLIAKRIAPVVVANPTIVAGGQHGQAQGTINLPCRYITTSYNVDSYTGAKYNESKRKQLLQVDVTFSRLGSGATPNKIKMLVHSKGGTDTTSDTVATMPYTDKEKFIESLMGVAQRRISQRMKPVDKQETIFSSGNVKLRLLYTSSDRQVLPELSLGTRQIVLHSDPDIAAVVRELAAL